MYRKNTAGQFLCVQLLLTATGAPATGITPAMRRCIDGTFAAGGGTFTEDGTTGSYKYAMSQADTNGNDISFIISGTGAIPVCINILTTAADPSDVVRFGLTAFPNVASGSAGALIVAGTGTAALNVTSGVAKADVDTIKTNPVVNGGTVTFPTNSTLASTTNITAGTVTTATNVTTVNGLAANTVTASALATDAVNEIADGLLNRDMSVGTDSGSDTFRTMRQALRFLRNKWAIATATLTVYKEDDTTASWTATVSTDPAAEPIISNDPAGP